MLFLQTAILLLIVCVTASAKSVTVGDIDGLRTALADPSSGDTIFLNEGIYKGSLEIAIPKIIIGTSDAIIDGGGEGDIIIISADSTVLSGITVQNSGSRLLKDMSGIKITGNFVMIIDCEIRDILHGIYVKGGNHIVISGNVVIGRQGIQESDRGNGIHLWNTTANLIENNELSYARDGIYFSFAHETIVRENHIHHLRYGLHYMYSDNNLFEDNLFDNNVAGSALMYSENIDFRRNIFAHCRGFRAYGILLQSVENCTATENLILDNTRAIFFDDSNHNRFEFNDIVQNDLAVQINASCEDNIFISNNFISNLSNCMMDASIIRSTHWSENGRGNYWSDYAGYDLDDDGVGDAPHFLQNVFEYLEADNPAVRFYLYSPASQLLAAAEKRLPILRKTAVQDPDPLFRISESEDVPWENLMSRGSKVSVFHAALWFMIVLLPAGLMLRLRR